MNVHHRHLTTLPLGSAASSPASACEAVLPAAIIASPNGPYEISTKDCVATTPTPACTQGATTPVPK